MILSLKIIRGVQLLPMDNNLVSEDSSDPYCEVFVNGEKIGWTPVLYNTLDPVWGGPASTFRFKGGGGTKITIKIFDRDELKADDPMGMVEFYASEVLVRSDKAYPNAWASVVPPEGYDAHAGKLEIRLLQVSGSKSAGEEEEAPPPQVPLKLSAGPKLSRDTKTSLRESIASAKAPVMLHVYDVGNNSKVRSLNSVLPVTGAGGIFHGAIEVYGKEYSFGSSRAPVCGIFACKPASCPIHTYRESVYLGDCELSKRQVVEVLKKLKPQWLGNTYDLLRKNCCFFSNELAIELGVGSIPEWVYSLANLGAWVKEMMGQEGKTEDEVTESLRTSFRSSGDTDDHLGPMGDLTLAYVMAVRLQRSFRARKQRRLEDEALNSGGGSKSSQIRRATVNVYGGAGFEVQD